MMGLANADNGGLIEKYISSRAMHSKKAMITNGKMTIGLFTISSSEPIQILLILFFIAG